MAFLTQCLLLASLLLTYVNAIPQLHQKGAKIFDSNGNQFYIKGIAYQLTPQDPLLDADQCNEDVALMKTLGTNMIRVYHVDPSQSHDDCMTILANAGIYLWLDLDTFTTAINQDDPTWNADQFSNFAAVMDAFIKYDNLAGFWISNEAIRTATGSSAAIQVKAAVTDIKAYRASKKYRNAILGYSAADIAELRPMLQDYLACGDESTQIEAFGLNSYEWCGNVNFNTSGYVNLQAMAVNYSVPIFFSETGCNTAPPRDFADQQAIFGPDMDQTWSGAIIYEWIQEANAYGLISYPNGGVSGQPNPVAPDFTNLQNQWKTLTPSGIKESDYTPSLSAPACPPATNGWLVDGNPSLPTLGVAAVTSVNFSSTPAAPTPTHSRTSPPVSSSSSSRGSSTTSAAPAATSSKSAAAPKAANERIGAVAVAGGLLAGSWIFIA